MSIACETYKSSYVLVPAEVLGLIILLLLIGVYPVLINLLV